MIDNPWHVDDMARMERKRIQEEMRQIRLEEAARHPRRGAGRNLVQMLLALAHWLGPAGKPASSPQTRQVKPDGKGRSQPYGSRSTE